jgi:hypothetical protein
MNANRLARQLIVYEIPMFLLFEMMKGSYKDITFQHDILPSDAVLEWSRVDEEKDVIEFCFSSSTFERGSPGSQIKREKLGISTLIGNIDEDDVRPSLRFIGVTRGNDPIEDKSDYAAKANARFNRLIEEPSFGRPINHKHVALIAEQDKKQNTKPNPEVYHESHPLYVTPEIMEPAPTVDPVAEKPVEPERTEANKKPWEVWPNNQQPPWDEFNKTRNQKNC